MEGCLVNFSGRWKILLGKPEYIVNSQICHRFGKKTLVVLLYVTRADLVKIPEMRHVSVVVQFILGTIFIFLCSFLC